MLMWLHIQPCQSQLEINIMKNKNNWCEANDMGVTINNKKEQIIRGEVYYITNETFFHKGCY
jgi:hypothetical protein